MHLIMKSARSSPDPSLWKTEPEWLRWMGSVIPNRYGNLWKKLGKYTVYNMEYGIIMEKRAKKTAWDHQPGTVSQLGDVFAIVGDTYWPSAGHSIKEIALHRVVVQGTVDVDWTCLLGVQFNGWTMAEQWCPMVHASQTQPESGTWTLKTEMQPRNESRSSSNPENPSTARTAVSPCVENWDHQDSPHSTAAHQWDHTHLHCSWGWIVHSLLCFGHPQPTVELHSTFARCCRKRCQTSRRLPVPPSALLGPSGQPPAHWHPPASFDARHHSPCSEYWIKKKEPTFVKC